jgi:oxaloacetate decarboxylase gamma subunit
MNIELLKQGFLLMIIGMGTVFFFLAIMIFVMNINSKLMKILNKYFPEEIEEEKTYTKKKVTDNDAAIALAICAAFAKQKS